MNDLKVKKRDGTIEPFSNDKLIASMTKAGVPVDASQNFTVQISNWAKSVSAEGEISSEEIRDKVIEVLSSEYPVEADNYRAYKKE